MAEQPSMGAGPKWQMVQSLLELGGGTTLIHFTYGNMKKQFLTSYVHSLWQMNWMAFIFAVVMIVLTLFSVCTVRTRIRFLLLINVFAKIFLAMASLFLCCLNYWAYNALCDSPLRVASGLTEPDASLYYVNTATTPPTLPPIPREECHVFSNLPKVGVVLVVTSLLYMASAFTCSLYYNYTIITDAIGTPDDDGFLLP